MEESSGILLLQWFGSYEKSKRNGWKERAGCVDFGLTFLKVEIDKKLK